MEQKSNRPSGCQITTLPSVSVFFAPTAINQKKPRQIF
ncbi:hypothetical protein D082_01420 [Synechocystis sp. PCC 6714]|nr:hypothetical protein D082_01420 [Synechocystis sp. PCC 6714]